jgi:Concanavalin A-like lectin/glucanases superfamily
MNPRSLERALLLCVWLAIGLARAADVERQDDPAGHWQLFVDDALIARRDGVVRTYHPFEKEPTNPIRGIEKFGGRGTVLAGPDGPGYRMWCGGGKRYYTSGDGLAWTAGARPTLDFAGSHGCASVIYTPWESDSARRYKMVSKFYEPPNPRDALSKGGGWYGSISADGIHWTVARQNPLFPDRGDVGKFCWDPLRRRYFGTPKIWTEVRGHSRRSVGLAASGEFDAPWPTAELMLVPDQVDDRWATQPGQHTQFYGLSAFAYESMYLGLLEVFRVTDGINDGTIHIELVTSRDGVRWRRMPGERTPILPVGPPGAWDAGMIKTPNHPVVVGGAIKLFYGASNKTHGFGRSYHPTRGRAEERVGGTGLATLRKDGFASLDAGAQTGSITTVPLDHAGGRLAVNYRAAEDGWIKVEALDEAGAVVTGYSQAECSALAGDELCRFATWQTLDRLPSAGRPVRLRFVIHNASLYSFHAGDAATAKIGPDSLAVLYSFEPQTPGDELTRDGVQDPFFMNAVRLSSGASKAAFGEGCLEFSGDRVEPWDSMEIDGSFRLDRRFTLAAMVKAAGEGRMRLFSSWEPYPTRVNEPPYQRRGDFGDHELLFDFDARATAQGRLRLVVHGHEVVAAAKVPVGEYHHLAATYDDGSVTLYLDGVPIGEGRTPGGEVTLLTNLRVGADCGPLTSRSSGPTPVVQFLGTMDDVLVVSQVLEQSQVETLFRKGAAALFAAARRP